MALDSLRASRSALRRDVTDISQTSGSEGEDAASEASLALSVSEGGAPGRMASPGRWRGGGPAERPRGFKGRAGGAPPAVGPDLHELKGLVWQQLRAQVPRGERLEAGGAYFDLEDFVRAARPAPLAVRLTSP